MEIKYLTILNNNRSIEDNGYVKNLSAISLSEINSLENTYNQGNPFPAALKELLFLAGKYCYVLDYGLNDTQTEMQESVRDLLAEYNCSLPKGFFAIDVYNSSDQFLFVFLESGIDDPEVYSAFIPVDGLNTYFPRGLKQTLSQFIEYSVKKILIGQNPF